MSDQKNDNSPVAQFDSGGSSIGGTYLKMAVIGTALMAVFSVAAAGVSRAFINPSEKLQDKLQISAEEADKLSRERAAIAAGIGAGAGFLGFPLAMIATTTLGRRRDERTLKKEEADYKAEQRRLYPSPLSE